MEQIITLSGDSVVGRNGTKIVLDTRSGEVRDTSGRKINLALLPDDVHVPEEIPTYLAQYRNAQYRADDVAPVVSVDHRKGKFRTQSADDAFLRINTKGSIQGSIPQIDPSTSLQDYSTIEQYVGSYIPRATEEEETNARFRLRQAAARRCQEAIAIDREHDVWDKLTTAANWNSAVVTTVASGSEWNGGASANPVADILGALEDSLVPITDIWMNRVVANVFIQDETVRTWMRQFIGDSSVQRDVLSINAPATEARSVDFVIPGLPVIHIVSAKSRSVSGGATSHVLGNHVVLTSSVSGQDIATMRTFRYKGSVGVGYETREFRVEDRGPQGGTMVVVYVSDVPMFIANNVGGLIRNVIQ